MKLYRYKIYLSFVALDLHFGCWGNVDSISSVNFLGNDLYLLFNRLLQIVQESVKDKHL